MCVLLSFLNCYTASAEMCWWSLGPRVQIDIDNSAQPQHINISWIQHQILSIFNELDKEQQSHLWSQKKNPKKPKQQENKPKWKSLQNICYLEI